jgi:hypothetical protein
VSPAAICECTGNLTMKTSNKGRSARAAAGRKTNAAAADAGDWQWADPNGLKVDPAFRRLIPLQSRGEFRALEQSLKAEGCRDPLLVWKGHNVVLDGHTRRDLCIYLEKQVKVREVELPDERAAAEYILELQRQRRNLTREAMSYFRGADYNATKQERGGRRRGRPPKGQSVPPPRPTTARRLAEKYAVSEKTMKRDARFAWAVDRIVDDYGDPEVRRKLLGADVKLTRVEARALLKVPAEERKAAVDRLIEDGELPREKKAAVARRPREIAERLVTRLKAKGEAHARSVVQQMARMLGLDLAEKPAAS